MLRVYFSNDMVADSESYSPSAGKPSLVAADWKKAGLDVEFKKPIPVSGKTIAQAHNPNYVQGVLNCTESNGFGNMSEAVAKSLPFTVGAMVSATKYAFKNNAPAAALCSGFHHATYERGGGFCTFNGLVIAAIEVHKMGCGNVGILDLDQHTGNGTDNIKNKLKLDWMKHYTQGQFHMDAEEFLSKLEGIIKKTFWSCGVVIFNAGADPHILDPLGGWLTTEQMIRRDRIVFETLKMMGTPVCWALAGGYQKDKDGGISGVLEIHRNTAIECLNVYSEKKERGIA